MMTSAHRYGGQEAVKAQIVDQAVDEDSVLPAAIEIAGRLANKDPDTLGAIKSGMYRGVVEALTE